MRDVRFEGADTLVIDGYPVRYGYPFPDHIPVGEAVVMKTREMVEKYIQLLEDVEPSHVVELGINRGGSVVLVSALARPIRHAAVELSTEALPALTTALDQLQTSRSTELRFGIDQADKTALRSLMTEAFDDEPLDLVIDDASHLLDPSVASFDTLFPRLRPGGRYVIEDWASEHTFSSHMVAMLRNAKGAQGAGDTTVTSLEAMLRAGLDEPTGARLSTTFRNNPTVDTLVACARERATLVGQVPLSRLGLDLAIALAETIDVVERVTFDPHWIEIVRGPADLEPESFRIADLISDCYGVLPHRSSAHA